MSIKLRIIDSAQITHDLLIRYPDVAKKYKGVGLLLILEHAAVPISELPRQSDAIVRPPNGAEFNVKITSSEQNRGSTFLFLDAYDGPPIIRDSEIMW